MDFEHITTSEQLDEVSYHLDSVDMLAIDLEFDKNHFRYGFNLCLMQIYAGDRCFLIDPLGDIDMSIVYPALEDPTKLKVVFAFGEDMRLLHSMGCFPKNIYDISSAAVLLNYPVQSMASLLNSMLGLELTKGAQKSNWFNRPLSEEQQIYAAQDVLYLFDAKEKLQAEATEKSRTHWIEEEHRSLDNLNYADVQDTFIKPKERKGLSELQWHVYVRLMELRESVSEEAQRPAYKIIDKQIIWDLAEDPTRIKDWKKHRSVHKKLRKDEFVQILKNLIQDVTQEGEGMGLSPTKSCIPRLSKEEYNQKRDERFKREEIVAKIYKPIQKVISESVGEHTAPFILGNKLANQLAGGNTENLRNYKRNIILAAAKKLEIELTLT